VKIIEQEFLIDSQEEWTRQRMNRSLNSAGGRLVWAFILLGVGIAIGVLAR